MSDGEQRIVYVNRGKVSTMCYSLIPSVQTSDAYESSVLN